MCRQFRNLAIRTFCTLISFLLHHDAFVRRWTCVSHSLTSVSAHNLSVHKQLSLRSSEFSIHRRKIVKRKITVPEYYFNNNSIFRIKKQYILQLLLFKKSTDLPKCSSYYIQIIFHLSINFPTHAKQILLFHYRVKHHPCIISEI